MNPEFRLRLKMLSNGVVFKCALRIKMNNNKTREMKSKQNNIATNKENNFLFRTIS